MRAVFLTLFLLLAGCGSDRDYENQFLQRFAQGNASPENFFVCHGYGCAITTRVALTPAEWRKVRTAFEPPPPDAKSERRQIAAAIAHLERAAGERMGTLVHQRQAWNAGDATQLDCIDQSVNTWTYLTLLQRDALLRYHRVGNLAHAGSLLAADIRNTATLELLADGTRYAVDPQLVDGPLPPPIMPLPVWTATWPPDFHEDGTPAASL